MAHTTQTVFDLFQRETLAVLSATQSLEDAAARGRSVHVARLELFYEMCFLRIYTAWENVLEEAFVRYLCAHSRIGGTSVALLSSQGPYSSSISVARTRLLNGRRFLLWHDPQRVASLSQKFFHAGPHEIVLLSAQTDVDRIAAVRHRIVHRHGDARANFDAATLHYVTAKLRGSRAGSFLRRWNMAAPGAPRRWIDVLRQRLEGFALQICS